MTFEYRDPDGDRLTIAPYARNEGPVLSIRIDESLTDCVVHVPLDRVEEVIAGIRDAARTAARQTTGQDDTGPTCAHCQGTGADPEDQGDYESSVHMYNPTTIGPCPECHGTGKDTPAVGHPQALSPEEAVEEARKAIQHVLQLFLDRVPRAELDAETMADAIADALSDELTDVYGRLARAEPAPAVGQPAEAHDTDEATTRITVDALARMLSAADVEINHGDYPTYDTLAESGRQQYRQAARYLIARLRITTRMADGTTS